MQATMPRLFALLLALLLPLQFAWGQAASYCGHEVAIAGASHLGHHEHVHESHGGEKPAAGTGQPDPDCGVCNASAPHALWDIAVAMPAPPTRAALARTPATPMSSAHARTPDRPQWPRLA